MDTTTKKKNKTITTNDKTNEKILVVHNDEIHSFDYVIDALMDICGHGMEQATQCAYLIHYKGKADVKKGSMDTLKPMAKELITLNLKTTIE